MEQKNQTTYYTLDECHEFLDASIELHAHEALQAIKTRKQEYCHA